MADGTSDVAGLVERLRKMAPAYPELLCRAMLTEAATALETLSAQVASHAARIGELERGLEPFARADRALGDDEGPYRLQTDTGYREIGRDPFRTARALLTKEPQ